MRNPPHYPLADDRPATRATAWRSCSPSRARTAKDAAELVEVEYEPLDAVVDLATALEDGAPLVHPDLGTNKCYVWRLDTDDTGRGDRRRRRSSSSAALLPAAPDPERDGAPRRARRARRRGGRRHAVLGDADPAHPAAPRCGDRLGMPETKVRVVAPDVGGGFGSKLDVYAEELLAHRARATPRAPGEVDRGALRELPGDDPRPRLRDRGHRARRDADGKITRCRARVPAGMGAYLQLVTPGHPAARRLALRRAVRRSRSYSFECTGVFTNTTPTDAYRGAGRPEATYAIERTMDALARRARDRPARAAPQELHHREFPATMGSGSRSTPATTSPRSTGCSSISITTRSSPSRRGGGTAAPSSSWESASRPTTRCAASHRRGSSARSATPPAAGSRRRSATCRPDGPGGHRYLAPRPGSRDRVGADRRRPARRASSTPSRSSTVTPPSRTRVWTRTAAGACRSEASRSATPPRR